MLIFGNQVILKVLMFDIWVYVITTNFFKE